MSTIDVTALALENIKRLQREYESEDSGLRFGLSGGGCSGYKYVLEFEESPNPKDIIFSFEGLDIYVSKVDLEKLKNSVIDWKDSLMESGFNIINPQAKQPCGCGESVNF